MEQGKIEFKNGTIVHLPEIINPDLNAISRIPSEIWLKLDLLRQSQKNKKINL